MVWEEGRGCEGRVHPSSGVEPNNIEAEKMEVKRGSVVCKIGCLNVRGLNDNIKQLEIGEICKEKKLDLLGLTETKLKGKLEINFAGYKGVYSGVGERVRAKERVTIVMSQRWWECMIKNIFKNYMGEVEV